MYYEIINDEHQLKVLMKNQICVITSVIKNFNNTIQKWQIDEPTFNEAIRQMKKSMNDLSDDSIFHQPQFKVLELGETLTERFIFLQINWDI